MCVPLEDRAGFLCSCLHGSGGLLAGANLLQSGAKSTLNAKLKQMYASYQSFPKMTYVTATPPYQLKKLNLLFKNLTTEKTSRQEYFTSEFYIFLKNATISKIFQKTEQGGYFPIYSVRPALCDTTTKNNTWQGYKKC